MSNVPSSHLILDAELRVLRLPTTVKDKSFTDRHGTTYRAKLYGKPVTELPNLTPFESASNLELLDSFVFDISDGSSHEWDVFSVKKTVEKSQRVKARLQLLVLHVESVTSGELVSPEQVGFSKAGRLHNKHALLVVYTSDGKFSQSIRKPMSKENKETSNAISGAKFTEDKNIDLEHKRVRRDTKSKSGGNKKSRRGTKSKRRRKKDSCRRKPLSVDFTQLGWSNWVIAPRGYNAYFCQGLCEFPIDNHLKPTNHATVQTILNSVAPSLAPQACCSPNKFSAISILFIDTSDNVIYKKYEDMVVERCGCKWRQIKKESSCGMVVVSQRPQSSVAKVVSWKAVTAEYEYRCFSLNQHLRRRTVIARRCSFQRVLESIPDYQHVKEHSRKHLEWRAV